MIRFASKAVHHRQPSNSKTGFIIGRTIIRLYSSAESGSPSNAQGEQQQQQQPLNEYSEVLTKELSALAEKYEDDSGEIPDSKQEQYQKDVSSTLAKVRSNFAKVILDGDPELSKLLANVGQKSSSSAEQQQQQRGTATSFYYGDAVVSSNSPPRSSSSSSSSASRPTIDYYRVSRY